jgi:hypothetical protein
MFYYSINYSALSALNLDLDLLVSTFPFPLPFMNSTYIANNVMTASGTVATLLFGLGTFLVDKLGSKYHLTAVVSIILIIGIAANVVAIAMSARAFGVRKYRFAVVDKSFYKDGKLDGDEIDEYRKMTKTEFYETFIWIT